MFSSAEKTVKPALSVQRKTEQAFFGPQKEQGKVAPETSFFKPVQTKLKVNSPDDAYEKEADLVAESVVNMPEPTMDIAPAAAPEIQRKEEESLDEEETVQTASQVLQRMSEDEQEESPTIQTKRIAFIQRNSDTIQLQASSEEDEDIVQTFSDGRPLSMYRSDMIQMSGRGPPAGAVQFQSQLHQSTTGGGPMAAPVGNSMSSRFGADFSSVRIHTGTSAQQMSKQVNAHAFTYGNHIYFNSGKYDPASKAGQTLLAHELTHTIQQGASPVRANVQRKHNFTAVQRKTILQRQVAPQLTMAVELATAEQGKVIANKVGPDGNRHGWERLMEYFETTFGKNKIVTQPTGAQNEVPRQGIKKKSKFYGAVVKADADKDGKGMRDVMPSWCGIFAFRALNKSGIPMPKWKLGESFIPPEAAYAPGHTPKPGDIAYKKEKSHYGLVVGMEGTNRVKSVNGNTAGDDHLGGEIQVQTHDLSNWHAYFNPLVAKTGNLRDPEHGDKDTEPKTFKELRALKYNLNRKVANENEEEEIQMKAEASQRESEEEMLQAKSETSKKEEEQETIQRSEIGNAGGFASNGMEYETDSTPADIQTKADAPAGSLVRNKSPGTMIQGGWLGSAWNAVSGLASDVADLIEEGIDAAKDWLLDKVRDFVVEIPGYTLLSYILGYDPITGRDVNDNPLTLLDAVLDIIPIGGTMVKWVLEYFDAINPVANWLFESMGRFSALITTVESRFEGFWNRLSIDDVGNPERVMNDVANLFQSIVSDIISFVADVGGDFLTMVKDIALTTLVNFVKDYFPDAYDLLILLLGKDPITGEGVDFTGTNILNAALKVLGERGAQIKGQMLENGIFEKCVQWIDRSIGLAQDLVSDVGNIFNTIWGFMTFDALFHPIDTFTEIAQAFLTPINRIIDFFMDAMVILAGILKKALLNRLSNFAKQTRGYFLITVLIGKDPFTGQRVERNTENMIHGFFSLMDGGEAQFQQLKESGKIDSMTQKVQKAVEQLNFTWEYVIGLFTSLWESLDWNDFLNPFDVFRRIVATFGNPIIRLIRFVITIVQIVVELLLIAMNFPFETVNNIIQRSIEAFGNIKRDPIGFLKNILRGIKQGFTQFFDNILNHLMSGLATWLFGSLGELGIQMPPDLSFKSILNLIMQILGVSVDLIMERVWLKLTEQIGAKKVAKIKGAIDKLTGIWTFIKDVIERGPIAIWEYVQEKLSELWNMVLDAAKNWIMTRIIASVTTKLLSMLDPTGIMAVINSVIAIYKAIQSFIQQLRAMLEILNAFVNGIAEIAAGNVSAAANFLEGAMARGIPVLIGFLANQVGLGDIGSKLAEIIQGIRVKIIEGIDWLVAKALRMGRPIIDGIIRVIEFGEGVVEKGKSMVKGALSKIGQWWKKKRNFRGADGKSHKLYFAGSETNAVLTVASDPTPLTKFLAKRKTENTDASLTVTIGDAINLSTEIDGIRTELNVTEDEAKTKQLDGKLEIKMASLVPLVSKLMGGLKILEMYLNKKVKDDKGVILKPFIDALETDKNKVDDKKVYGIRTTKKDGKTTHKIVRQSGMAAKFLSIAIVEGGMLMPSPEKEHVADHKNYIPEKIIITEDGENYEANYTTKTFNGDPGPTFKINISYEGIRDKNKNSVQIRTVTAQDLVFKPEGNPRGVTDSATGGFHNAHIIGDRFGGSGKNRALNIYPSSPKYNTGSKYMLGVEDKMAKVFSTKAKFDLTVTARISEEVTEGGHLREELIKEFKKDNQGTTAADDDLGKELSNELQKAVNKDLKELPGKFLSVTYNSSDGFPGKRIEADPDYKKTVKEFEKKFPKN